MTIVDKNKLIAFYMGGKQYTVTSMYIPIHGVCIDYTIDSVGKIIKYHKSWDWLIPVIDKIMSSDSYHIYLRSLSVFDEGIYINTKSINDTYNDVVNYIVWYNENKGKNKDFTAIELVV